jgi:hypothetical protein
VGCFRADRGAGRINPFLTDRKAVMSDLTVRFRGLFTLVRHVQPLPGGRSPELQEDMTIVFARDDVPGGGAHSHALSHVHRTKMLVHKSAVLGDSLRALAIEPRASVSDDYQEVSVEGLRLWLPVSGAVRREPVRHVEDEVFSNEEDRIDTADVGPGDHWHRLSRLACLDTITGASFDIDVDALHPDENRLQGIVQLSGGRIECVRSHKSLGDAFIEFFTRESTKAIQPFSEDVDYIVPADPTGSVEIGVGLLHDREPRFSWYVPADVPLVITSLPPEDVKANSLNHFSHYYPLMKDLPDTERAFVRMLAWWDGNRIRHTMPPLGWVPHNLEAPIQLLTTGGPCSCAASRVFKSRRS